MNGKFKSLILRLKQDFLNICLTHCFIHREALTMKTIPDELKSVLHLVIKVLNYINLRAIKNKNSQKKFCRRLLLLSFCITHRNSTAIGCKVFNQFYEIKYELL